MKCYTHQLSFAAAVAMALFYTLGALAIYLFPYETLKAWSPLMYLTSGELFEPFIGITLSGFFSGLLQSFTYTYAYAWILSTIYNALMPGL